MALLEISSLSVALGDPPVPVLEDVSLACGPGSLTLLLGANGCGKSVLLRTALGLVGEYSGRILLDKENLNNRFSRLHRISGVVFQNPDQQLFGATVAEDLEIGLGPGTALDEDLVDRLGIRPLLHRPPGELSGGQRRTVAIAGALASTPSIILLDEPFIELDYPAIQGVLHLLETRRAQGATIIVASHESQDIWPLVDQLVILSQGRLFFSGDPAGGRRFITAENGLRPLTPRGDTA